jgi:CRISPR-associated protein Cmx8
VAKRSPKQAAVAEVPVELRYTLAELPSSQHRAGLVGLALMVQWLGRQPPKARRGVCEIVSIDEHALVLRIDRQGLRDLFDQVYGATMEEQRVTTPYKTRDKQIKEPLRIDQEVVEETTRGKTKTKAVKYYVYPRPVPRGAFLVEWDEQADEAGNGLWIKLWRDVVWSVLRGVPATRAPFEDRAAGPTTADADKAWEALAKGDAAVDLASTHYLGAQASTAENVSFRDRARYQFLLHFWPFVAQIYVPTVHDREGKEQHHGYAIAMPDVASLRTMVEELPPSLRGRDGAKAGFRPRGCLLSLSLEGGLDLMARLAQRVKLRESMRSGVADLVHGIDVFHVSKEGNNVRVLGVGRIEPDEAMIDHYWRVKGELWDPSFRRQRLVNLIAGRAWYDGFDRLMCTSPWQSTIGGKYFGHDARKTFEEQDMSTETLEAVVYKMVGMYLGRKTEAKQEQTFEQAKAAGNLDERNKLREKLARDAFLAARSRTGADFVDFFTSTLCSVPQHIKETEYAVIAKALLDPAEVDRIRTLTMLALSARG